LSVIGIALVIELAFAVLPLGTWAATDEVESPPSAAQVDVSPSEQSSEPTPAGIADLLTLGFIALLWTLSNKLARHHHHHRTVKPRRDARSAAVIATR
jgi:hypothetical protein